MVLPWKQILEALDPWRELTLQEVETLFVEREDAPFREIAQDLEYGDPRGKHVLCGARGAGKTTELIRLSQELQKSRPGHEQRIVLHVDVGAVLPENASTLAIVALLATAAVRALALWAEPEADIAELVQTLDPPGILGGAVARLKKALHLVGVAAESVGEMAVSVGVLLTLVAPEHAPVVQVAAASAKAAGAVIQQTSRVRQLLQRDALTRKVDPDNPEASRMLVNGLNETLEELRTAAGRELLVVCEGLDKLKTAEQLELALSDLSLLEQLETALVLSGPIQMRHHLGLQGVHGRFLLHPVCNVAVRRSDGSVDPNGIAWLKDALNRRVAALNVDAALFDDWVVEDAAARSAGLLRDFFRLLHEAVRAALRQNVEKVGKVHIEAAIRKVRLEMQGFLDEGLVKILRRVLETRMLPASDDGDMLLYKNFVVCYPNGDLWYRPHELLVDFVKKAKI